MKIRLEGVCKRQYTSKTTGLPVTAVNLEATRIGCAQDNNLRGNIVIEIGVDPEKVQLVDRLELNKIYDVDVDTFVGKNGRFCKLVSIMS